MEKPTDLITADELAVRLRVTPDTVKLWARRGVIPRVCLTSKVIRYDHDAVIKALRSTTGRGMGHE